MVLRGLIVSYMFWSSFTVLWYNVTDVMDFTHVGMLFCDVLGMLLLITGVLGAINVVDWIFYYVVIGVCIRFVILCLCSYWLIYFYRFSNINFIWNAICNHYVYMYWVYVLSFRLVSLVFRICANIIAGHLIMHLYGIGLSKCIRC